MAGERREPVVGQPTRAKLAVGGLGGLMLVVTLLLAACSDDDGAAIAELSDFEGTWTGHSRSVTIDRLGHVEANYRTYRLCSEEPAAPCNGHEIVGEFSATLVPEGPRSAVMIEVEDTDSLAAEADTLELLDDDKLRIGGSSSAVTTPRTAWNAELDRRAERFS